MREWVLIFLAALATGALVAISCIAWLVLNRLDVMVQTLRELAKMQRTLAGVAEAQAHPRWLTWEQMQRERQRG